MKTQHILSTLLTILLGAFTASAAVPVVTNVVASQRSDTKLVDINFDALDADGDTLTIAVEVSHTGGETFNIPATSYTGDYGDGIVPGTGKLIVWDAGADWDGEYSTQMVVKVIASDTVGFPGLEWGSEVPLGGFLMGQEGGVEGVGASKHVNIPWSYWLSKYEITCDQYCEFLNIALAAGDVIRNGNSSVTGNFGSVVGEGLITLGSRIFWNVNSFEVSPSYTNHPVIVTFRGAVAFAEYFGYDLPTDAEWEKAARGPDHGGVDQHQLYPWGDTISGGNANYSGSGDLFSNTTATTPVGYYNGDQIPIGPDMISGYGLYDIAGNVSEWTRSISVGTVENYPAEENLNSAHNMLSGSNTRINRGGDSQQSYSNLKCYYRGGGTYIGFRVIRRSIP